MWRRLRPSACTRAEQGADAVCARIGAMGARGEPWPRRSQALVSGLCKACIAEVSATEGIIGSFSRNSVARPHPKQQPI